MSHKLRFLELFAALCAIVVSLGVSGVIDRATAAPLNIGASASMDAYFLINDGVIRDDIAVSVGVTTALSGSALSTVEDAAATNSDGSYVQVGNPFNDPPTPFIATEFNETTQPDGDEARGFYYVEQNLTLDDSSRTVFLDRTLAGTAALDFTDIAISASASSDFEIGRDLVLTNTSDATAYAFEIATGFDMSLAASADDLGSQSIAEAVFSLSFITSGYVALDYLGSSGNSPTIDDSDPGVSVANNCVVGDSDNNVLLDGVNCQASVSATGTGAPTDASFETIRQFFFGVIMAPGSSLRLSFFQSQNSATSYIDPSVSEVPLPASALLFLGGLGFFSRIHRNQKPAGERVALNP
ncbi:hypothetical protein [Hyphococcus sp.]|jgi:hypothetical protein|uniref:hypothetical protein n=1 Tax=Hyphococcus sp. TaxID=2038636 RepID=UPI003D112852